MFADVEPRGVRLTLEYGSSPTTFRKPAFIAGFHRFGVRQSLFADVEPCMRQPKLELTLRWLALGQLLGFKTGLLE